MARDIDPDDMVEVDVEPEQAIKAILDEGDESVGEGSDPDDLVDLDIEPEQAIKAVLDQA